jgi:hypothetical protein
MRAFAVPCIFIAEFWLLLFYSIGRPRKPVIFTVQCSNSGYIQVDRSIQARRCANRAAAAVLVRPHLPHAHLALA